MQTIILCGGQGTRLREETEYKPKQHEDVGGKPILWHIMKLFAHYGHREYILCLGYKGSMIKDYFLNYEAMNNDFTLRLGSQHSITYHGNHTEQDFQITLADTGPNAMTGSRVKQVERFISSNTFMVTYGDGLSDVNIEALLAFHRQHGRLATVTTVRPVTRYGILDITEDGMVRTFREKPRAEGWANAGFFVFDREVFRYLQADPTCILEDSFLRVLAEEGQLMAYRHEGFFFAMDTYREYLHLNHLWDSGQAPWALWRKNVAAQRTEQKFAISY